MLLKYGTDVILLLCLYLCAISTFQERVFARPSIRPQKPHKIYTPKRLRAHSKRTSDQEIDRERELE